MEQQHIQHLYWRASFGIPLNLVSTLQQQSKNQVINQLISNSSLYKPLPFKDLSEFTPFNIRQTSNKKDIRIKSGKTIQKLNLQWLEYMVNSVGIREKMALFWHDHFACAPRNPLFAQQYVEILRANALGNFGTMLIEVSKSPAMLTYLNNIQNVKGSPNENFAREVMELFTLGRDTVYTEKDIQEAARCFTGWKINKEGQFFLHRKKHDTGVKTVLGVTDALEGEDVLLLLLKQKETAYYICKKLYSYLVNEHIREERVQILAKLMYQENYEILPVLKAIFLSNWFYENENIGTQIKSPITFIVGTQRQLNLKISPPQKQIYVQRILGQILLSPPNVAGWKSGTYWIDNNRLMFRLKWVESLLKAVPLSLEPPEIGDDNDPFQETKEAGKMRIEVKLDEFMNYVTGNTDKKDSHEILLNYLLQVNPNPSSIPLLRRNITNEQQLKSFLSKASKLPEYQVC
ncbi:DUF1800 domain-containing protein [Algivirga pacifica]|uniref:DUF1800 domain-containing protein n=1 Tax=Algivirga pacifica TaxID=1162670 RepID=A0ABP9D4U3_9BACT